MSTDNTRLKAVIVDLDGTLAYNNDRGMYDWSKIPEDGLHDDIANLLELFAKDGYRILVVTARIRRALGATRDWLHYNDIPYDHLFMKEDEDDRADTAVKEAIYHREIEACFDVDYVLEDRDSVVKMWRSLGLRCLQVAEGAY